MDDNSTHIEVLANTTTSASNIDVSMAERGPGATETPEKEFSSVYSFSIVRACM